MRPSRTIARTLCLCGTLTITTAGLGAQNKGLFLKGGKGCPGAKGMPVLTGQGYHRIRGSTVLTVAPLQVSQGGVLLGGSSATKWGSISLPLDLTGAGMPGCKLHISPDLLTIFAPSNSRGIATSTLRWPDDLRFVGMKLYLQHVGFDPHTKTPTKLIMSDAGMVLIACNNSLLEPAGSGFQVTLPRLPKVGFPGMSVSASYKGQRHFVCCHYLHQTRACSFAGNGPIKGSVGSFPIPVGPIMTIVTNNILAALKKVSGGTISGSTTLDVTLNGMSLGGNITVSQEGSSCGKASYRYMGQGDLQFGSLGGSGQFRAQIKIGFIKKSFSFGLSATGTPTGTWLVSRNTRFPYGYVLGMTMKIPNLRIRGSVKIPIVNKTVGIDFTVATPHLLGATFSPLPKPAICR